MSWRRWLLGIGSAILALVLIVVLIKVGKINLRLTLDQLRTVSWLSFTKLFLLNCVLVYLSTEKWRIIDAAWRRASDSIPSRITAFAHTSFGFALGIFLPVQLAMSTARAFGTQVHGRPLKRGAAGTLFEQGFDFLTVFVLAGASGATRFYHGRGTMWILAAAVATLLLLLVVKPSVHMIRRLAILAAPGSVTARNKWGEVLRSFSELQHSGLLNVALARRLVMLSLLRFGVVVLMSVETAEAIGLHIPFWQMGATVPFVVIASVLALTPGGLGVNELTSVTALRIFGTPLTVATQWAVANRILIAVSYLSVALFAAIMVAVRQANIRNTNHRKVRPQCPSAL
jgi:Lysylphosphatidylglycerol synthase TM region